MTHKEKLQPAANAIFGAHGDVNKVFLASNGQGFTDEDKADAYAQRLADKKVYIFERNAKQEPDHEVDEERAALLAKYEVLYGKKAMFNISTKTLMERIADKEAELNPSGANPEGAAGNTATADEDTKPTAGNEADKASPETQAADKEA